MAASDSLTAGLSRPDSIEYLTRKMPPSASASPPAQTAQRAPSRLSKLSFAAGADAVSEAATRATS